MSAAKLGRVTPSSGLAYEQREYPAWAHNAGQNHLFAYDLHTLALRVKLKPGASLLAPYPLHQVGYSPREISYSLIGVGCFLTGFAYYLAGVGHSLTEAGYSPTGVGYSPERLPVESSSSHEYVSLQPVGGPGNNANCPYGGFQFQVQEVAARPIAFRR